MLHTYLSSTDASERPRSCGGKRRLEVADGCGLDGALSLLCHWWIFYNPPPHIASMLRTTNLHTLSKSYLAIPSGANDERCGFPYRVTPSAAGF